ncbi:energy transducer TonB [Stanieria cyanosphaera]|uniref:energy transducer TonB n=1 Tax=Stanieria cyanosphaera TaxID=102116 RepID=UPI0002DA413D|nr:energy transducer TonB [Stanieria cyanosphaera]
MPVIELTPEEEARLPNLNLELDVPEFNTTPLDNGVQSFALPPSIGPNGNLYPDLVPIPLPPPPNFNLPPLPPLPPLPSTDIKLPPIGDFSSLPLPPPLPPLESDSQTNPAIKPPATIQAPPEKLPEAQKPEVNPPQPQPKPPEKPATQPNSQQIAAQRQQRLNKNVRDLSSSLQKKEGGSTDEDARKNYVAWLNQIKTVNPEIMVIEGTYPRDACIRRLEGTSVYGVVVDASGQVLALELIKGSEYPIFNEQASQALSDRKFNNQTNQPKPYQVTVNYQYDAEICPSLTLPSLRKEQETKPETPLSPQKPQNIEKPPQPASNQREPNSKPVENNNQGNQTPEAKPPANPPQPQPINQTPEAKPPANPPQPQPINQTPEAKPPANPSQPQPLNQTPEAKPPANPPQPQPLNQTPEAKPPANPPQPSAQ